MAIAPTYQNGRMNLRAALLAAATAGALLLVAACGGGGSDSDSSTGSSTSTGSGGGATSDNGSSGSGSSRSNCQPQTPTTVVGGDLFVAQQGTVGLTLLSDGGLSQFDFTVLYDNLFGLPTSNRQDRWGQAKPFPPGTPVGTSVQLTLEPPTADVIGQPLPSTFPKGIPVELWLRVNDGNFPGPANSSSTAWIGKDIPHDEWFTASVTYGPNDT
ncbi:MAG: hypothetical protein ABR570_10615, partial [Burkholderiales bacterium]